MGNRMGYRILNFLLQYNTHVLIVILLVAKFFWDHKYHTDIFFRHTEIYEFLEFVTYAVITVLFIFNVLCVKYKATTNRKFIVDRLRYGCSYHYLINYFKDSDMHSMDIRNLPIKHWTESNGIILGKVTNKLVELPPSAGKNIAMFGIPKSGKTVTLISTCMQYSGSILAIDIKGDIYNATHKKRQIKVFSPSEPEASMLYNPLYGISQKDSE